MNMEEAKIGDIAYISKVVSTKKKHPCPDCNDAKVWAATSPAGDVYEVDCMRCVSTPYHLRYAIGSLDYSVFEPGADIVTLSSITLTSRGMEQVWSVGGGYNYTWPTRVIFSTKELAIAAATEEAFTKNSEEQKKPVSIGIAKLAEMGLPDKVRDFNHNAFWSQNYHIGQIIQKVRIAIGDPDEEGEEIRDGAEQMGDEQALENLREMLRWNKPTYHLEALPLREFGLAMAKEASGDWEGEEAISRLSKIVSIWGKISKETLMVLEGKTIFDKNLGATV